MSQDYRRNHHPLAAAAAAAAAAEVAVLAVAMALAVVIVVTAVVLMEIVVVGIAGVRPHLTASWWSVCLTLCTGEWSSACIGSPVTQDRWGGSDLIVVQPHLYHDLSLS